MKAINNAQVTTLAVTCSKASRLSGRPGSGSVMRVALRPAMGAAPPPKVAPFSAIKASSDFGDAPPIFSTTSVTASNSPR
jgi:hypothetical protein